MLVKIEEIKPDGLELSQALPVSAVTDFLSQPGGRLDYHVQKEPWLTVHLSKIRSGVLLKGQMNVDLSTPCKRCLRDSHLTLPISFTLNLVPEKRIAGASSEGEDDASGESTGSFDLGDADQEVFDGKTIDLYPILREQVLLALPLTVVCQENCRGLCSVCGQNLNEKECGCERKMLDPRLMALKNIKLS